MKQIRLCGLGGQGIVMAGAILAHAAFLDKKFVGLSSGYSSQVRGGVTISDLVFSDTFIDFPLVTEINILLAMLQEGYQESLPLVNKEGIIILDGTKVRAIPDSSIKHYTLPATETAIKELKSEMAANIILLAAANSILNIVSEASLKEGIKSNITPRFIKLNIEAMRIGLDLVKKV